MTSYFSDNFNRTVAANGWGNSWSPESNPNPYSVDGSVGLVTGDGFNDGLTHAIGSTVNDWDIVVKFRTTNNGEVMMVVSNGSTGYGLRARVWSDTVDVIDFANVYWNFDNFTNFSITMADATWYWYRLQYISGTLKARAWADGASEPSTWDYSGTPPNAYSNFTTIWLGSWGGTACEFDDVDIGDGATGSSATGAASLPHLTATAQARLSGNRAYSPSGIVTPGGWWNQNGDAPSANVVDEWPTANDDDYLVWKSVDGDSGEYVELSWPTSIVKPKGTTSGIVIRPSRIIPWR